MPELILQIIAWLLGAVFLLLLAKWIFDINTIISYQKLQAQLLLQIAKNTKGGVDKAYYIELNTMVKKSKLSDKVGLLREGLTD